MLSRHVSRARLTAESVLKQKFNSRHGHQIHASQSSPIRHRTYASIAEDVTATTSQLTPGSHIHGFTLKRVKHVPELHLTAFQLEHDKTGAEYLHVARDDKNNVFAISFKTNPTDRTGLPHILEHVTLCGSENYPVRDPFFKMMPRSLANFMNAFTSSDYTSYPFATTNPQDYRNLSAVYLDATLHPLLKRSDFLQEGWRLGPENPREPANEENVKFKGVVYNEMKGQMSDSSYLYYVRFREHLFPSLHNSGGDPEKMTDLTYEQLVEFSRQHYHPSNAKIYSYGSLDVKDQLAYVNEALSKFNRIQPESEIKSPISLDSGPVKVTEIGPLDSMQSPDRQVKSSVTWQGCAPSDIVENFSLSVMSSLLMSGYGSPLYQGLIEAGLGSNFAANTGYDASAKVGMLSIGLDGMQAEAADNLAETIHQILREKGAEAFQGHKVEGYMHQLEIALKHKTAAFGMGLLDKTLPGWFNGVDPIEGLAWNDVIDAFRQRLSAGNYLESLMEKYLLNDNYFHFTMSPAESYNTELETKEEARRQKILEQAKVQANDSAAVFSKLGQQELDLLHEQENAQTNNIDTLPTLRVEDILKQKESKPVQTLKINNSHWLLRETSTNGITYFQAKHVFEGLSDELRILLPLFTECLMRLGTKSKSVGDLEAEIMLKTGGISVSPFTRPDPDSLTAFTEGLMINGYALDRNLPAMLDLMHTLLVDINFDSPQATAAVLELLDSKVSGSLDSVAETGHHFAIASAAAALTERGRVQEQLSGLSQIEATVRIMENARSDPESLVAVIGKLKTIQRIAMSNSGRLSVRTVCEPSSTSQNQKLLADFLQRFPDSLPPLDPISPPNLVLGSSLLRTTFFNLPFQVSYTGACLQTVPYTSADKAPLTILGQLLTHNYMHPEIREKGGAYGASASASPISGLFTMSSYRDPNPRNSLSTFEQAGRFARDKDWSSRELEESKLSVFQGIDAPSSVSSDGSKQFMYGITEEMDQQMRERLLEVTKEDVHHVAQKYFIDLPADQKSVCVLGEKKDWLDQAKGSFIVKTLKMTA